VAQLKKELGLAHVFCIASGAMISSGLFVLPGLAHARAGPAVVLSYLLAALLAASGLLSIAELATAMPKAGGDYFFITRGLGPAAGTVAGLLNWFSLSLKSAFALVGMGAFAQLVLPLNGRIAGLALCALFVLINLVGVKEAARLQVLLVVALLGLMVLFLVRGLPAVSVQRFEPFAPSGIRGILATAGFVFVAYGGLLKIVSVSEETKRPGRTIPLGMLLSLVVVSIFYVLMVFVTSGVLDDEQLHGSLTPISDAAGTFLGQPGAVALGVGAVLAFLTTANAGIMAASRYLLAMSRDRLLPSPLSRVGRRFQTPHVAVLVTGGLAAAALLVNLDILVKAASTVLILSYILSNVSIIVLRESGVQNYRPRFRAPLYPWVQGAGIIGFGFVILEMGEAAFAVSALLVALGFVTYWFYGRPRVRRESALLHLIERITAKELVTGTLETELKQVIRERDEIVLDRFDRIIEESVVVDVGPSMPAEELFGIVAARLAGRLGIERGRLVEALTARERESSTVIAPALAVPHVVIEGEGLFDIALARSREGFAFGAQGTVVYSVFVLVGSKDERNFHLQALSAIAQIVQEPGFEKRWMAARGQQQLRDLVLLAARKRA
jgi:amino acid transporter/mannitol/fructose-specific phosphotransferase system IIA component (Ntr-type)